MRYALAVGAAALALWAAPAFATGEVYCEGPEGSGVVFGYGFGRVPGLAVISATIEVGDQSWSVVEREGATQIVVLQGAYEGSLTIIDFADQYVSEVVASVRLVSASEGRDFAMAGTLRIPGVGAFALVCDGG